MRVLVTGGAGYIGSVVTEELVAQGEAVPTAALGRAEAPAPRVVFVFPGQGSQWLGMGRELLAREPAFRTAIEAQ